MLEGPSRSEPNLDSISEDFEKSNSKQDQPKAHISYEHDDNGSNNQQLKTGLNNLNQKIISDNVIPLNDKIPKIVKDNCLSKKRKRKKKSKEIIPNFDNSFKAALRPILGSVVDIAKITGKIEFLKFKSDYYLGGIKQNNILYKSRMYQILGFKKDEDKEKDEDKDYKKILEEAKFDNLEDEKIFNYFLTSKYGDLYKKYYTNDRKFLIGGEEKTIKHFKIYEEALKSKRKNIYGFIKASEKIFNNFEGCKEGVNKSHPKHYDTVKIERFNNLIAKESLEGNTSDDGSTKIQKKDPFITDTKEKSMNESKIMAQEYNQINNISYISSNLMKYEEKIDKKNEKSKSQNESSMPREENGLIKNNSSVMDLRNITFHLSNQLPINLFNIEERDDNNIFQNYENFFDSLKENEDNEQDYLFSPLSEGSYIYNNFDMKSKFHLYYY